MQEKEIYREAKRLGNSAGVLLPKKLLGSMIKITLVDKPLNIKKDVIKLLLPYFQNIIGICLIGFKKINSDKEIINTKKEEQKKSILSQENKITNLKEINPEKENIDLRKEIVEILAISFNIRKTIHAGKYKIDLVPLNLLKRDLKEKPDVREKIIKAKSIMNKSSLLSLKKEAKYYSKFL